MNQAIQVGIEHPFDQPNIKLADIQILAGTGVGDQGVDFSKLRLNQLRRVMHLPTVGDVGWRNQDIALALRQLLQRFTVAGSQHQSGAAGFQCFRQGSADAG